MSSVNILRLMNANGNETTDDQVAQEMKRYRNDALFPALVCTPRPSTVVLSFHSFAASSKSILLEFIFFNPAKLN
jgi:hypothetical protein